MAILEASRIDLSWENYFERLAFARMDMFVDAIKNKMAPLFETIDQEADAAEQAAWERLTSGPGENSDPGSLAEQAQDESLYHFELLLGVRQGLLNLAAVSLYHLFEQELLYFHKRDLLSSQEEDDARKNNIREFKKRVYRLGVKLEEIEAYQKVNELRLLSNCVKHGDGRSCSELRKVNHSLFEDNYFQMGGEPIRTSLGHGVGLPLAGEDIYVEVEDLESYVEAIKAFWRGFWAMVREMNDGA